jgi:hypothetical protein
MAKVVGLAWSDRGGAVISEKWLPPMARAKRGGANMDSSVLTLGVVRATLFREVRSRAPLFAERGGVVGLGIVRDN